MKTLRSLCALLLTLCLLALGAALPLIVGEIQNRTLTESGFGQMQSVDLKLKEPLSLEEKLYILSNGQFLPIGGNTNLTPDRLPETVEKALGPFYYRELVPYNWKGVALNANAYIIYQTSEPEINYIMWIVVLEAEEWRAELYLDDETGKAMMVTCTGNAAQELYTPEEYTEQCKNAWFESLELSESLWEVETLGVNGNTYNIRCYYSGEEGRDVTVEFSTFPDGFWTFFLDKELVYRS